MKRLIFVTLFLIELTFLVSCVPSGQKLSLAPDQHALAGIRSIYLGSFGGGDGSDLVREKMRVILINSGRFEVVENQDRADALLIGTAGVDKHTQQGTTNYSGAGFLRIVDTKTQKTIWAHEYERGFMFGGSVSSRVAKQMADQLLKDAGVAN